MAYIGTIWVHVFRANIAKLAKATRDDTMSASDSTFSNHVLMCCLQRGYGNGSRIACIRAGSLIL